MLTQILSVPIKIPRILIDPKKIVSFESDPKNIPANGQYPPTQKYFFPQSPQNSKIVLAYVGGKIQSTHLHRPRDVMLHVLKLWLILSCKQYNNRIHRRCSVGTEKFQSEGARSSGKQGLLRGKGVHRIFYPRRKKKDPSLMFSRDRKIPTRSRVQPFGGNEA